MMCSGAGLSMKEGSHVHCLLSSGQKGCACGELQAFSSRLTPGAIDFRSLKPATWTREDFRVALIGSARSIARSAAQHHWLCERWTGSVRASASRPPLACSPHARSWRASW
jgi:hypothetical protein